MRERLFRFKQFAVSHSAAAMKVGTDGVTLGAWASVSPGDSVLDVGAGCGLIGLMMAQRGAASVTLLEIDPAAAAESAGNAAASPWADAVTAICADFMQFDAGGRLYDRMVCNPPFFTNGELAPDSARATARHEAALTLESLTRRAAAMLAPGGTLSVIIPAESRERAEFAARMAGLHCCRITLLHTKAAAPPRRVLMEFSATPPGRTVTADTLLIGSEAYRSLTSPFYL